MKTTLTWLGIAALTLSACGGADTDAEGDTPDTTDEAAGDQSESEDEASSEPVLIGYSPSELDATDYYGMFQIGLEQGLNDLGVNYEIRAQAPPTAADHTAQFNFVEELITIGADIIIIAPTEYEAQMGSYAAVNEAGIPLFITNYTRQDPPPGDYDVVQYAAFSHEEGALAIADWIEENLDPDDGDVAILRGVPGALDDGRSIPVMERFDELGFNLVAEEYADFQRDRAYNATEAWLVSYPNLNFIYAASSAMASGAINAVEADGLTPNEDVSVWGYGGNMDELDMIMNGRQGGTVYRNPIEIGRAMAEGIAMTLEGRQDEVEDYNAPMRIITTCEEVVEIVPAEAFAGEWEVPTLEDCN